MAGGDRHAEIKNNAVEGGMKGKGGLVEFPTSEGGLADTKKAYGEMGCQPNVALPELDITKGKNGADKQKNEAVGTLEKEKVEPLKKAPKEFNPPLKEMPKIGKEVEPGGQSDGGDGNLHKILPQISIEKTVPFQH